MFCTLLGHTGERLQDHWSSGFNFQSRIIFLFKLYCKLRELFYVNNVIFI